MLSESPAKKKDVRMGRKVELREEKLPPNRFVMCLCDVVRTYYPLLLQPKTRTSNCCKAVKLLVTLGVLQHY